MPSYYAINLILCVPKTPRHQEIKCKFSKRKRKRKAPTAFIKQAIGICVVLILYVMCSM